MKLIYVANARMPTDKAHGHQISTMCNEYAQLGYDVELWVPTRNNPISKTVFEYYGLPASFKVRYIPTIDFIQYDKIIGRLGGWLQVPSFMVSFCVYLLINSPSRKNTCFLSRVPEVVFVATRSGYPSVFECHDWFQRRVKLSLWFLKKATGVVATNSLIADEFICRGFRGEHVHVAPNGVKLERFALTLTKEEALDRLQVSGAFKTKCLSSTVLMYTGSYTTMNVDKGIELVLDALKSIPRTYFIAVGGAEWELTKYRTLAQQQGVLAQCCFRGRVSQDEIATYQQIADILVMPFPRKAHYERHMSPIKMFEYMASGRPIVATRLSSIEQVLRHESNAVLIEPGSLQEFILAIQRLKQNERRSARLAKTALSDVAEYAWRQRAERISNWVGKLV